MLEVDGLLAFVLLGLWIYCIFDVITTDESLVRNLPKLLWLMIVFMIPDIGSIIWLVVGRPERASFRIGDNTYRPQRRPVGIEDRADFGVDMKALSTPVRDREEQAQLRVREEQLRRREEELRRREEALGQDPPPPE